MPQWLEKIYGVQINHTPNHQSFFFSLQADRNYPVNRCLLKYFAG